MVVRGGIFVVFPLLVLISTATSVHTSVLVSIDKATQQMTVSVDGETRYTWPVSTGYKAIPRRKPGTRAITFSSSGHGICGGSRPPYSCYNETRTHLSLHKDAPLRRAVQDRVEQPSLEAFIGHHERQDALQGAN